MARTVSKLRETPLCRRLVRKLIEHGILSDSIPAYALLGYNSGWGQKAAGACSWELFVRDDDRWVSTGILGADPATMMVRSGYSLSAFTSQGSVIVNAELTA